MAASDVERRGEDEMLNWGRLLLDGLPFADLIAARDRDPSEPWLDHWLRTATRYEALGERAETEGHRRSAGEWYWLASLCAQYAQFLWFGERRAEAQARKVALYRRAAPFLAPPAERVDVQLGDTTIVGYLRLPEQAVRPVACAVLLGGLESTKEESYAFENLLLDRGVATFTFDGPGQGEMLEHVALSDDFHRYTRRVVDALVERSEVDPSRLGVLGRSLGGLYALQSASTDQRLRACVSWGGFVDMEEWDAETPMTKESWRYVSKVATLDEARVRVQACLDIRPLLGGLECPTFVLHGALDEVPMNQVDRLRALAVRAPLEIVVEPDGDHCCHNLGPAPRVHMADWLAGRLGS